MIIMNGELQRIPVWLLLMVDDDCKYDYSEYWMVPNIQLQCILNDNV
jgi:hypothetical protein